MKTSLCEIMTRHGSDKGSGHHNYTIFYSSLFDGKQLEIKSLFEIGLGTNNPDIAYNMGVNGKPGASLRGWKEYFPNALIYGADIDREVLFEEERIKTFYCDQTNPEIIKQLWNSFEEPFDVIIDDGLHEFKANKIFLENSLHKLKPGGYYIVEDLRACDLNDFNKSLHQWIKDYQLTEIKIQRLSHPSNSWDNNLLVIKK